MACDGNKVYVVATLCKDPVLCIFDPVLLITWPERYLCQQRAEARGEVQELSPRFSGRLDDPNCRLNQIAGSG